MQLRPTGSRLHSIARLTNGICLSSESCKPFCRISCFATNMAMGIFQIQFQHHLLGPGILEIGILEIPPLHHHIEIGIFDQT